MLEGLVAGVELGFRGPGFVARRRRLGEALELFVKSLREQSGAATPFRYLQVDVKSSLGESGVAWWVLWPRLKGRPMQP